MLKRAGHSGMATTVGVFAGLALALALPPCWAHDDDDGEGIPFDVAQIFFELNNTDADLGIHALIDGEEWRRLQMEDPHERRMLDIRVRGRLARQGLTELFFESAEPTFDELSPEVFFSRFPEGEYKIEGITVEGDEMESKTTLTHVIPAPPAVFVNGEDADTNCDDDEFTEVGDEVTISWLPVTLSHSMLGTPNVMIDVVNYEVVVEIDETQYKTSIILPPEATSFEVPAEILKLGDEIKYEVLVREASFNQTAIESCFEVVEDIGRPDGGTCPDCAGHDPCARWLWRRVICHLCV